LGGLFVLIAAPKPLRSRERKQVFKVFKKVIEPRANPEEISFMSNKKYPRFPQGELKN
jgi:hypothetical protein